MNPSLRRLEGIGLVLAALFFFAWLDTTAKYLSADLPPLQIVWVRFASHLIIVFALWNPLTRPGLLATQHPWLQFVRAALMTATTFFNFKAVQYLQLSETASIMFAAPFLVAAIAGPLLGEWAGPRRWAAIVIGFVGVLVVLRPGLGGLHWAAIFSVGAMICYALYLITTRMLAVTDGAAGMLIYSALLPTLLLAPAQPFIWIWPHGALDWVLLLSTGLIGATGHFFLIKAHAVAPAPVLAPFAYSQIVWMVAFGYFVFTDIPTSTTLVGAAIVIFSGLYLLARERVRKEEPSATVS
ncbi:MAG: DMT family transporter [Hyphomicrobiales bacterium]|nr:DMT family transporter [Hyphomicrobiales bacterium]